MFYLLVLIQMVRIKVELQIGCRKLKHHLNIINMEEEVT